MKIKCHWIIFLLISSVLFFSSGKASVLSSTGNNKSPELIDDCTGKSMIWECRNPLPNSNRSADIAMVIQYSEGYVANSDYGPFISHPRIIMILFKEARKNRYRLAVKNSSVIIESSHPALLEPFKGLEIENKVLSITFSFFQSMGTWEVTGYIFKFRYQNGAFTLIGEDYSSSWRNRAYPDKKISCNYLTGKKKTTTEIPIDNNNSRFETIWTDINNNVQTLDSISDLFSLQPE